MELAPSVAPPRTASRLSPRPHSHASTVTRPSRIETRVVVLLIQFGAAEPEFRAIERDGAPHAVERHAIGFELDGGVDAAAELIERRRIDERHGHGLCHRQQLRRQRCQPIRRRHPASQERGQTIDEDVARHPGGGREACAFEGRGRPIERQHAGVDFPLMPMPVTPCSAVSGTRPSAI